MGRGLRSCGHRLDRRVVVIEQSHLDAVLAANRAFYAAFEARDFDAMSDLWEHSDRVSCVHPGWGALRGWGAVAASWAALFQGPESLQFILTDERAEVVGDVAWVTVDENILGGGSGSTVAAVNLFVRGDDGWRLVMHHGSPVVAIEQPRAGP
ncbi:MAG: nuclear transport factor 2 family protein [Acidimicrobiales bacterium]|nr:nuclear transport factor 2 family protein [Acidimicrobiales bacterium]